MNAPVRRPQFIARQSRCPSGLLGRLIGHVMSAETAAENAQALAMLELQPGDRVLEVGFGHGRTIAHAALSVPVGFIAGIDRSAEMARMAARHCRHFARNGTVGVAVGDSAHLPFADERFEKALSVHTVYFWSDPIAQLGEIRRVLRHAGRFVLAFRPKNDAMAREFPEGIYTFHTPEEVGGFLEASGFAEVDLAPAAGGVIIATASRPVGA